LGLGKGLSVLELIKLFENTTGTHISIVWGKRRVGDVDTLVCDAKLAIKELQWVPKYDAVRMCEDFWRWQTMNPKGYRNEVSDTNASKSVNGSDKPSVGEESRS